MKNRKEENLNEVIAKFYNVAEADAVREDIEKGDAILRENPVLEVRSDVLAGIKAEVEVALERERVYGLRQVLYKVSTVAAGIIVVLAVSLLLRDRVGVVEQPRKMVYASIIPAALWESDDVASSDEELLTLSAEIEEIERDVLALALGENGNGEDALLEVESELVEIDSEFWKG